MTVNYGGYMGGGGYGEAIAQGIEDTDNTNEI